MTVVCPTVTAENAHQYRVQIERIAPFVTRAHLDFMDGVFAPTKSPDMVHAWWPHTMQIDLHIMYEEPQKHLETAIKLNPRLVIVHAEAKGNFVTIARTLHEHGIQAGIALLADTPARTIEPALQYIDHVLVFSGDLGHFGGKADLALLNKVKQLKTMKSSLEIGWDGGINDKNAVELADGGVDVLNVGGFIQRAEDPKTAYEHLKNLLH